MLLIFYRFTKFIRFKISKNLFRTFYKNHLENTAKCFDGIEKKTLTAHFSRATLLDPRFKKAAFGVDQNTN